MRTVEVIDTQTTFRSCKVKMYLRIIIVSFLILLLGGLIGFLGFPFIFQELVMRNVNLKPGSETRQMWEQLPFPMNFKIYVFNVSNAEDIESGGKPKIQEVGPFVYEEWKDKYNLIDIDEEDAISFNMRNTFIFRADLGLSGEEILTMPHPLLQFMAIATLGQAAEMQAAVAMGLDLIFKPKSAFITATFKELFYDGIDVNCDQDQPAAEAICKQLSSVPGVVAVNATHYKFSLMGGGNHTNAGQFKVSRSRAKMSSVGRVLTFNDADQLQVWQDANSSCNRFHGTDGTIFAPYMKPQQGLWSYSAQLCRSITPKWMGKTKYGGLPAQRYELSFGSARRESELACFCSNYPTDCPADGTMDLIRCSGSPLMASLPHFYQADAKLLEFVEGLEPTAAKHASVIIFEQLSGSVLSVFNRLQFSLKVEPVKDIPTMSQLRSLSLPLFWIEESLELDESITKLLHKKIFAVLNANNIFRWVAIGVGSLGCALGALFMYMRRNDVKRVGATEEGGNVEQ